MPSTTSALLVYASSIVILACYQRGSEWQTPPVGAQNSQALSQCSDGRLLANRGFKRQKHKLDPGKDEDGNEENIRGNSEKRPRRSLPSGDRFACPYHKKNRARFSSGPWNGKGFENIDRLKAHLKLTHGLSIDRRRCHVCKRRFLREELDGHSPCERKTFGDDYEDGYDLDQAQDLRSDPTRPSKNPPESCWKAIFKVLFPDWPVDRNIPSPCQANAISDAIQQHRNRMMSQDTISQLYACRSEDEIRQTRVRYVSAANNQHSVPAISASAYFSAESLLESWASFTIPYTSSFKLRFGFQPFPPEP
nr:hypothetical protein FVER53263_00064 [Fusarium verticillioides]